jgi:hypothetical protein
MVGVAWLSTAGRMTGEELFVAVLAGVGIVLMMIPYAAIFGAPIVVIALVFLVVIKLKPPSRPDTD